MDNPTLPGPSSDSIQYNAAAFNTMSICLLQTLLEPILPTKPCGISLPEEQCTYLDMLSTDTSWMASLTRAKSGV